MRREPETWPGGGIVTFATWTEIGMTVGVPSATRLTEPAYVPGAVPCGTVIWTQIGWFVSSVERWPPFHGSSTSGTSFPLTET